MIKCKGIPDVNQAFAYMYFKTENEGYLFGTYTEYEELSEKELENPNNIPKSTDEANIYKTIDGGKNWVKINSSLNYSYFNIGTQLNDYIYILRNDVRENYNFSIVAFDIKKENIKNFTNIKPISAIWTNNSKIFYTNNRGPIKLYSLDKNQNIDSIDIENYALQGLGINEKSYAIFSSGETSYFGSTEKENKEIRLSIMPQSIVRQGNNTIIIAGNTLTDKNEISLISYKPNARQSRVIKIIKNYSIIKNLQSNDKAIIGFIGNIKGAFTEYDLLYSLDKGKTWQIKKLEEPNYVRPNCLINNIVYIYSGGARMQKIVLQQWLYLIKHIQHGNALIWELSEYMSDNQCSYKQLGIKAGINSLPFAIFVTQNKEKMNLRERFGALCSRLGVEFQYPNCHSNNIIKSGKSSTGKQRYRCKNCQNRFITVYNIQSLSS